MCVSHRVGPCGGPPPKEAGGREEETEGKGTETERLRDGGKDRRRDGNRETHREAERVRNSGTLGVGKLSSVAFFRCRA